MLAVGLAFIKMHELSIAISLLDVAGEEADRLNAQVVAIHLQLGPLSGVVKDALLSAFELARETTSLATARLEITETPITAWCDQCQIVQPIASVQLLQCPACGSPTPDVRGGREMEVTALEILDDNANANGGSPPKSAEAK